MTPGGPVLDPALAAEYTSKGRNSYWSRTARPPLAPLSEKAL